jgi:uncharacterized membrane protein YdjX (TVP38/TMEM64 family)
LFQFLKIKSDIPNINNVQFFTVPEGFVILQFAWYMFCRYVQNIIVKKEKDNCVKPSKTPLIVSISIVVVLVSSYFIFPDFKSGINEAFEVLTSDDQDRARDYVAKFGFLGPIIIILGMMAQMFMFIVPNILLMMIAIICYGPVWGSIISLIGVFAASSLGYWIGCHLSPITLNKFVNVKTQDKISAFIKDYGVSAIMITRLSSFSNDALSFVAGLLSMSYKKYILATLTGITPLIVLLAIFGQNGKIEWALIIISAVSLIFLVVYIIVDKRKKKSKPGRKTRLAH